MTLDEHAETIHMFSQRVVFLVSTYLFDLPPTRGDPEPLGPLIFGTHTQRAPA